MASSKSKILKQEFFDRSSIVVARDLIGKFLVRKVGRKIFRAKIVETEAYDGFEDKASKAHRGQTPGNTPMFGESGRMYVYFTYGMHWLLNITCGKVGHPSAVLIRGVEGITGPARLTKKLNIDKRLNTLPLGKKSGLWIEEGYKSKIKILKTPRIGIDSSGPVWSKKLYRFIVK